MDELTDDICRNNHGGNTESEAANDSIDGMKNSMHMQILDLMHKRGTLNAEEAKSLLGLRHQTAYPRFAELKRSGAIALVGYVSSPRGRSIPTFRVSDGTSIHELKQRTGRANATKSHLDKAVDAFKQFGSMMFEELAAVTGWTTVVSSTVLTVLKRENLVYRVGKRPTSSGRYASVFNVPLGGLNRAI